MINKMFDHFGIVPGFKMNRAGACPCSRCNNPGTSLYPIFTIAKAWHLEGIIKERPGALNIVKSSRSEWRYSACQVYAEDFIRLNALAKLMVLINWTSIEKEIIKQVLES